MKNEDTGAMTLTLDSETRSCLPARSLELFDQLDRLGGLGTLWPRSVSRAFDCVVKNLLIEVTLFPVKASN